MVSPASVAALSIAPDIGKTIGTALAHFRTTPSFGEALSQIPGGTRNEIFAHWTDLVASVKNLGEQGQLDRMASDAALLILGDISQRQGLKVVWEVLQSSLYERVIPILIQGIILGQVAKKLPFEK